MVFSNFRRPKWLKWGNLVHMNLTTSASNCKTSEMRPPISDQYCPPFRRELFWTMIGQLFRHVTCCGQLFWTAQSHDLLLNQEMAQLRRIIVSPDSKSSISRVF